MHGEDERMGKNCRQTDQRKKKKIINLNIFVHFFYRSTVVADFFHHFERLPNFKGTLIFFYVCMVCPVPFGKM